MNRLIVRCLFILLFAFGGPGDSIQAADYKFPVRAKRILFLGDSITHAGHYVAWIETQFRLQGINPIPEMINIGLPSETCSGLSEPEHPFPRPDVHERLDRALAKVKPDVVVACYGMNDGIYYPFSEKRFEAYQSGINKLIDKVDAAGAKLVLVTPPPFDPVPLRKKGKLKPLGEDKYAWFAIYEDYDDVLARYSKWITEQSERVDMVVDVRTPINSFYAARRKVDPDFTVSSDGVHINAEGHQVFGEALLRAWGVPSNPKPDAELLKRVFQRMQLLHDAWLSHVGHKRPGVKKGLPLDEAIRIGKEFEAKIEARVKQVSSENNSKQSSARKKDTVRFATFNAALNRKRAGLLALDLKGGGDKQAQKIAEIIQRVRPDVLLINEFDYDEKHESASLFDKNYLQVAQGDQQPIVYPHRFLAPVNTGVDSGLDLNGDGKTGGPADGFGFGNFPGQYGMVAFSKLPIKTKSVRTFQKFRWEDLKGRELPVDPKTKKPFYSQAVIDEFRLSSKSHWDLPIAMGDKEVHFLVCHPTPPVFDGPEDRNGLRNRDEIRFWSAYIDSKQSDFIYDDQGRRGGLASDSMFVIAGDLNADPIDGDSYNHAAQLLTRHALVNNTKIPSSAGGPEQSKVQGRINKSHQGNPAYDTCDFNDFSAGNLRIDYVLPSRNLKIADAGVFWPKSDDEGFDLVSASDHRLVWVDVALFP